MDEIRIAVNDLIQTKKTSEPVNLFVQEFKTIDLRSIFDGNLSSEAKKSLNNRAYKMVHQWNEPQGDLGLVAKDDLVILLRKLEVKSTRAYHPPYGSYLRRASSVKNFGFTTTADKVVQATLKLVEVINHMSKFNQIVASLKDLNMVELYDPNDLSIKKYAIVSYLAIRDEEHVKNVYGRYMFEEGGIPPEFI